MSLLRPSNSPFATGLKSAKETTFNSVTEMKIPTIAVMLSYVKMKSRLKLYFRDATKAVDMDVTEVAEVRPAPYGYPKDEFRRFL